LIIETISSDKGVLTYQWYSNNIDFFEGATNNIYKFKPSKDGVIYIYCVVTNTLNGDSISIQSDIVCVTINRKTGLSVGTITLIVIGREILLVSGGFCLYYFVFRKKIVI